MLGLMLTKEERKEMEYILKRELEELLFDFEDERIHEVVKKAMEERYKIIFCLFRRVAKNLSEIYGIICTKKDVSNDTRLYK
ncbi:hypothetical protein ACTFRP_07190 [Bacillus cereus group sp. MYBK234-1]|uniref:hypothetical protein n=1 Tax=unclassified Bacillus cereus group TaxID=2750818 RepID=UPI003F7938F9